MVQPPCSKPPSRSSSLPPGACITPSSDTNSLTISFLIESSIRPFNVPGEVVQDRLPALTLELGRVLRLRVERLRYADAARLRLEFDRDLAAVAHAVLDQLARHDPGVGTFEVEAL